MAALPGITHNFNYKKKWWEFKKDDIFETLDSSENGLKEELAQKKLRENGANIIQQKKKFTAFKILLSQFENWLIIVLIIAALISHFIGSHVDAIVIISLVLLSVFFGFIQEYKASKVLEDLKKYISDKCRVRRAGKWEVIETSKLVMGDIVNLHIGDKVPADIRLLTCDELLIDESIVTGESLPVNKTEKEMSMENPLPTRLKNIAFMGTTVVGGYASGIVIATGKNTYVGKTSKVLQEPEPQTDFQIQISTFSKFLFKLIILMTIFIFGVNSILNKGILESFLFAVALAVGITPEMLPAIITITLSQGATKMAKKKVIMKRLLSVEDLGNIDTLCVDKTGTLTEGKFSLHDCVDFSGQKSERAAIFGMLCTGGISQKSQKTNTNPIDNAIWDSSFIKGLKHKVNEYKLLDENEFDFERKRMSVLVSKGGQKLLIAKGSFDSIVSICTSLEKSGKIFALTPRTKESLKKKYDEWEKAGYRVIAVASKEFEREDSGQDNEKAMVLMGALLFKDPLKEGVVDAISKFGEMGVTVKVISGDSVIITKARAREAGLVFDDKQVVDGEKLGKLSKSEFAKVCKESVIFARITPELKHDIVNALNYEDHIVGFLGDGVNDVAALRAADVGISVDTSTQIAKDASDVILLQKDLRVLSTGIEAGRKTFGNIMKYILNTISANYGNMSTIAISSLFLKFIPLLPSQILLNNFISDIPLFAVATDNVDKGFVQKPKRWNIGFIKSFMIYYGFVSMIFDMGLILPMIYIFNVNAEVFRTAWFVESSISEILVTFAIRTKLPFYKSKPSKWLLGLSIVTISFILVMPFAGYSLFYFVRLPYFVWLLILIDLVGYFAVTEVAKKYFFQKFEKESV